MPLPPPAITTTSSAVSAASGEAAGEVGAKTVTRAAPGGKPRLVVALDVGEKQPVKPIIAGTGVAEIDDADRAEVTLARDRAGESRHRQSAMAEREVFDTGPCRARRQRDQAFRRLLAERAGDRDQEPGVEIAFEH